MSLFTIMDGKSHQIRRKICSENRNNLNNGTPSSSIPSNSSDANLMDSTMETSEQSATDSSAVESSLSTANVGSVSSQRQPSSEAADVSGAISSTSASHDDGDDNNDNGVNNNDDDDEDDGDDDDDDDGPMATSDSAYFDTSSVTNVDSSAMSVVSGDDDASDVCSSIADCENVDPGTAVASATTSKPTSSFKSRKRSRLPPIMVGYKKRRRAQHAAKKFNDESIDSAAAINAVGGGSDGGAENGCAEAVTHSDDDDKSESSRRSLEQSSSEENLFESSMAGTRSTRKYSSVTSEVTGADKFCWICHKDGGGMLKCITCPRVYHSKCHFQAGLPETPNYDPSNFHCPECSAVLKADNVNTRSPVLVTVNLEQLCTLLKHIISILKSQKDSHYFWGPVDTKEFPHYRHYVVYPMDISLLEKNIKNKVYGCTEAFLADVKWIVHNSIVFNSRAAKITNVAKNLLKICKREIQEIETCAECYYNSLVRKDTWFIEVCKKPHLLVWARLKGYPPWPAKAMKCKDGMVDCRFFGAHDKAWVPLKDCFLYSKITPQPVKVKKGSHLESGIQELEKHIKKLRDKFGIFVYPSARIPYRPSQELEQLRTMLPNYSPTSSTRSTKYLIHPDRIRNNLQPKTLFNDSEEKPAQEEDEVLPVNEEKQTEEADSETNLTEETEKTSDSPPHNDSPVDDSSFESSSEAETSIAPADATPPRSTIVKVETSSSTSPSIASQESCTPSRKLVSVKNIESINASVANTPNSSPVSAKSAKVTLVGESKDLLSTASAVSAATAAAASESPNMVAVSPSMTMPKVEVIVSATGSTASDEDFDLNKVKDEPLEGHESLANDADVAVDRTSTSGVENRFGAVTTTTMTATSSSSSAVRPKRPTELAEDEQPAKKVKAADSKCRTVNITENVTLSLVNQSPSVEPLKARPPIAIIKQKTTKPVSSSPVATTTAIAVVGAAVANTLPTTSRVVYGMSTSNDIGGMLRPKTMAVSVGTPVIALSRPNTKVQPRVINHVSQTNGVLNVQAKPAVTVTPSRLSPKTAESYNDFVSKALDSCLVECQSQFRKILESTLDKLAGKGDLRARVVSLKKEMETMKRSHELAVDEMKRDYEVQIAELRATSVAKMQFDLAAERLKFEQEKEHAVKEAKSKQWCSNCQKIANYYCCWNTAYCDFECQKEHWIQHMHVCKNDVKKKTPESCENEPPRIMMQSEISNGYPTNGYDKSGSTYSYSNVGTPVVSSHSIPRGNFNRPHAKISTVARSPRPLLPRVTCTVASSLSSNSLSPSSNGGVAQNAYQSVRQSTYSVAHNASTVYSPLYQK